MSTTSSTDFNTCAYTPFSAFSLEYELTVSRRQSIVLLCVRFPTFWSPGRIPGRLHEIQARACRRRSHSFHVSYFFHPIGKFTIVRYWYGSQSYKPFLYSMRCRLVVLPLKVKMKTNFWHLSCFCLFLPLELARRDI
jgi:hypothetical protein